MKTNERDRFEKVFFQAILRRPEVAAGLDIIKEYIDNRDEYYQAFYSKVCDFIQEPKCLLLDDNAVIHIKDEINSTDDSYFCILSNEDFNKEGENASYYINLALNRMEDKYKSG